jgi:hypothetical protein
MSRLQTIVFDKKLFTKNTAINWMHTHGHPIYKIDVTTNHFRFRQKSPGTGSYYSKYIEPGVLFVFEN